MSRENLELVRSIYAAWEGGDFAVAEWADPEIEYVGMDGPDPESVKGLAEMARSFRTWLSTWEEFRLEATEYRELDPERVLVLDRSSEDVNRPSSDRVRRCSDRRSGRGLCLADDQQRPASRTTDENPAFSLLTGGRLPSRG
jgi:hypothetical protein